MGYQPYPQPYRDWHEHFAWIPTKVNGEWLWLKKIYRKRAFRIMPIGLATEWKYGTLFDVLKDAYTPTIDVDPPPVKWKNAPIKQTYYAQDRADLVNLFGATVVQEFVQLPNPIDPTGHGS